MSARLLVSTLTLVLTALPALAQDREVPMAERGYMGIRPSELNNEIRAHFKIDQSVTKGLVLTEIFGGTAAAKAGLRAGDVLTKIDNKPVNSIQNLMEILATKRPGTKLAYVARRGTGTIAGLLVLGRWPAERMEIVEEALDEVATALDAKPKRDEPNLDRRMDKLSAEIEVLRKRALKRKARAERGPRKERTASPVAVAKRRGGPGLEGWIERERKALAMATKQRNERKIGWHRARLSLLEEMAVASRGRGEHRGREIEGRGRAEERMMRVEKRLIDVMERIELLERQLKKERQRK